MSAIVSGRSGEQADPMTQHHFHTRRRRGEPAVANIKSQIKRNRQAEAAHERNKSVKTALKSAVRKFRAAADSFRTLSSELTDAKNTSDTAAKSVLEANRAKAIDAFGTSRNQLSGNHVRRLIEVCGVFADVLEGACSPIRPVRWSSAAR